MTAPPAAAPTPVSAPSAAPAVAAAAYGSNDVADRRCPNCGTPAPLAYCPACGQAQHSLHRSLRAWAAELLDTFAGWDGKIPATLWLLFRHPGRLTAEYLAGRRARFLPPLRLYLSLSVLLVLAFQHAKATSPGRGLHINFGDSTATGVRRTTRGPARDSARAPNGAPAPPADGLDTTSSVYRKLKRTYFGARVDSLGHMPPAERQRALKSAFFGKLGNMFFALVPVFALLVGALYWRGPFVYAEHLVFALHAHAFAAAALTALVLLPGGGGWRAVPALWVPAYLFVALRAVYGGSRRRTAVKLVLLGGGYLVALLLAILLTLLVAVFVG